jgi:heme-degrading monooxygenase HmoA
MLLRIWKVSLTLSKAEELETFANTISLPMFKAQPGCLAVFFTRTASECATVTVWSSPQSVEAMESSAQYQHVVRQIGESGILKDNHVTEVFSVYGGFTTESLFGLLPAAGADPSIERTHPGKPGQASHLKN